jgi:hypothetical protein
VTTPPLAGESKAGLELLGSGKNDLLKGSDRDDVFTPGSGHDTIIGGSGTDSVRLAGHASDYTIRVVDGTLVVSGKADSSYAMSDIEVLEFTGGQGNAPAEIAARLYAGILGRAGNAMEIDYWSGVIASGGSVRDVAIEFVNSDEAAGLFRASGSAGFVTALYESVMGRKPATAEINYWVDALAKGGQRADVALEFINSREYLAKAVKVDFGSSEVGVLLRLYNTMFGRAPDEAGLNYWLEQSAAGVTMSDIANNFAQSTEVGELSNRDFIDQIYDAALHRDPTAAETAQLLGLFDRGLDRGQILLQVSESPDVVSLVGVVGSTIELA